MPEPITLAVVGGAAITEGIKFLYGQATEALKRRREHKEAANAVAVVPANATLPAVFESKSQDLAIHLDTVGKLEGELKEARTALADYADGIEEVSLNDANLLEQVNALRRIMEAIYGQRLTFQGETRAATGPDIFGTTEIEEIKGYAAGVRVRSVKSGTVRGAVKARTVSEGGQAIGVDIDRIG